MLHNYQFTVTERFLRYVQIDTQSDPENPAFPSSEKQKSLSHLLADELKAIGLQDAHVDEYGYVLATIPASTDKKVPTICFCSHVDTAPDCSGTDVKPIVHQHYNGYPIVLPDDETQIITTEKYPYLKNFIGKDIITASGKTLLGADDKSGVAIIMDLANYLQAHPEIIHGAIKILFTPDEETGRGVEKLDMKKLGADFGYTLDGGECGTFEDETFSADAASITINGVIAHPGYAKGKLINAIKIAGEILDALPKHEFSPETTSGREGFIHPVRVSGIAEKASIDFIVRDFITDNLAKHEERLKDIAQPIIDKYIGVTMEFSVKEQYRNMKDVLVNYPQVAENALLAYERSGLTLRNEPIRGGTDGSRLSYMGLPCPNIFTGMQAIHSKHEWVAIEDMEKAVEVLINLVQVWEEKA
ncbi:peptidase T [Arachidicoccus ginsenosidimutans]|nr:peptidase T [Arachidicoccus sp. BS20]